MAQQSLEKSKIRFLLLEGVHPSAIEALNAAGYLQHRAARQGPAAGGTQGGPGGRAFLGIRSRTQLTDEILDAAPRLVAIGCFCIGTNQVDLGAAAERGIAVFNAPFSNTRSVAELVIAEAILLLRGLPEKNAAAHRGEWLKSRPTPTRFAARRWELSATATSACSSASSPRASACACSFHDVVRKLPMGNAQQLDTCLDALLADAPTSSACTCRRPRQTHRT
jgi:D-3-phosphoglycerate dehydrogenase